MSWSKHELEAIRKMPKRFIKDGTMVAAFRDDIFVCHNKYAPVAYNIKTKKFRKIIIEAPAGVETSGTLIFTKKEA